MNAERRPASRYSPVRRLLERLGVYLLVGPAIAAAVLLALSAPTPLHSFDSSGAYGPVSLASEGLLLLGAMYIVALPIVVLYAALISAALIVAPRILVWHVAVAALMTSSVLYLPMLVAMAPSEGDSTDGIYWRAAVATFLPVFTAGLVCLHIAPYLHRRTQSLPRGSPP